MKAGFKLILFQLFTGYTIGYKVIFDGKVQTILDFTIATPFRRGLLRSSWRNPIHFILICKNEYGGIETFGHQVAKKVFDSGLSYNEIQHKLQ